MSDVFWTFKGKYIVVEQVQHEILESPIKVYNFKVADNHAYFVGQSGVGVHNAKCGPNALPSKKDYGHTFEKHGAQNTKGLQGTAAGTGKPQGQWLHNENAANLLNGYGKPSGQNTLTINIPDGYGQVIMPNGTTVHINTARIVFMANGTIRTAYPILP